MARKRRIERIRSEPEVPSSKMLPATDLASSPEKNEETRAINGKRAIGIKNLDFGNWIVPRESVRAKKAPIKTTITVARSVILAAYRETESDGKKNTGKRKTNPNRQYSNILLKSNF